MDRRRCASSRFRTASSQSTGLLALAKTAEDERVRLAAWIEIANRSDGKPKEAKDEEDGSSQPLTEEMQKAVRLRMAELQNGQAS